MKLLLGLNTLPELVKTLASQHPRLATQDGAKGACKMASYELCKLLRKQGIDAHMLHLQDCNKSIFPDAHKDWADKESKDWSHYVASVGDQFFDLTARQYGDKLPFPLIGTLEELRQVWKTVEVDSFLDSMVVEFNR